MCAYPLCWIVMCGVQVARCSEPGVSRDRLMFKLCLTSVRVLSYIIS